jgi:hypothetical protein
LATLLLGRCHTPDILAPEGNPMRKVEHIEQQIRELSSAEFAELRDWVLEQDWAAWDAQIEADSRAGKLDKLIAEAKADYDAGRARKI